MPYSDAQLYVLLYRLFLSPEHQRQFDVAISVGTSEGYNFVRRRNSQPSVGSPLEMFRRHSSRHLGSVPNLSTGTRYIVL